MLVVGAAGEDGRKVAPCETTRAPPLLAKHVTARPHLCFLHETHADRTRQLATKVVQRVGEGCQLLRRRPGLVPGGGLREHWGRVEEQRWEGTRFCVADDLRISRVSRITLS